MRLPIVVVSVLFMITACGDDDGGNTDTSVTDTTPADTTPADTTPADTTPADTTPADTTPADTTPADTSVTDTTPADTEPTDTEPTDTEPTDTEPSDGDDTDVEPPADEIIVEGTTVRLVDGDEDGVITVATTIRIPDGGTLDCDGLELHAAVPTPDPEGEDISDPDVAIFLPHLSAATVRDCGIIGFEFGIYAAGGGGHTFEDNTIETRNAGITLLSSSGNTVTRNTIRFGAVGVSVFRDADDNVISDNDLVHTFGTAMHRVNPGVGFDVGFAEGVGVLILDGPIDYVAVINVKVGDELLQFPSADNNPDDNRVESNTITLRSDTDYYPAGLYVAVRSNRTTISDNTITGGGRGIHLPGYPDEFPLALPGRCAGDPNRYCRGDDYIDCEVPGIDTESLGPCTFEDDSGEPAGTCGGAPCATSLDCADAPCTIGVRVDGRLRVQEPTIVGNRIEGTLDVGVAAYYTRAPVIRDNEIRDGSIGIELAVYAPADAIVQGNTVSGNELALFIDGSAVAEHDLAVTANDFVDNALGLEALGLITALDGNYWGYDACPGFLAADTSGGVADCAPFVVSVAAGVPDDAIACGADTRPRELDGICAFDAPASLTAADVSELSYPISLGYSGELRIDAYGLAAAEFEAGTVEYGELPQIPVEVPTATRHLRVKLTGEPGKAHDLDLIIFDGSCDVVGFDTCDIIAAPFLGGSDETVDLELPEDASCVIAVDPWYLDGESATYVVQWWLIADGEGTLAASAPSEATAGSDATVELSWPAGLAPGTWLGIIDHSNEHTWLRTTLLEVSITP